MSWPHPSAHAPLRSNIDRRAKRGTAFWGLFMPDMRVVQVPCPHGDFELVERPIPEPHAGQVLIKIEVCGICYGDAVAKRPFRKGLNG